MLAGVRRRVDRTRPQPGSDARPQPPGEPRPQPPGEPRPQPPGEPRPQPPRDAGFTMLELVVSIAVIGLVMTSLTAFFVATVGVTSQQSGKQTAIQLAADGTERVRALLGSAVLGGRDRTSVEAQWASPAAGVTPYLADSSPVWDGTASYPQGATAPLPTVPRTLPVSGLEYQQHFYVGACWQSTGGGDCVASAAPGAVELLRVVVAITWPDRHCAGGTCSYVTPALISGALGEPVFDDPSGLPAPVIDHPGDQRTRLGTPVHLQLTAAPGIPPMTWSGAGFPPGLSIASDGLITGVPTEPGRYSVNVRITDARRQAATVDLIWTITAPVQVVQPPDQTTQVGDSASVQLLASGGVAPLTWSVASPGPWGPTGLPPGLALDPATGVISGAPTTAGAANLVTVTATDLAGEAGSASFRWTVTPAEPALRITAPSGDRTGDFAGDLVLLLARATGGDGGYSWTATGLPPGVFITRTGFVAGVLLQPGSYPVTLTVTDSGGARASLTFTWVVWPRDPPPTITSPTTTRTNQVGASLSLQAQASAGIAPLTWSATSLPAGLSISPSGLITGQFGSGTRYLTTLTVTDAAGRADQVTFGWNVDARNSGVYITAPLQDRPADRVGQNVWIAGSADGPGQKSFTWTATGLPPGITMTSGGVISGRLTQAGTYLVTVTATGNNHKSAVSMFSWTVR